MGEKGKKKKKKCKAKGRLYSVKSIVVVYFSGVPRVPPSPRILETDRRGDVLGRRIGDDQVLCFARVCARVRRTEQTETQTYRRGRAHAHPLTFVVVYIWPVSLKSRTNQISNKVPRRRRRTVRVCKFPLYPPLPYCVIIFSKRNR